MKGTSHSIPVTPVGKPRMTRQDRWKQRPAVVRYRYFCDVVREQLPGYQLPLRLHLVFYIPMPKSWSAKKRQQMRGAPHDSAPDVDNMAKAFMDAFKSEDKHVYWLQAEKYWSEEGAIEVISNDSVGPPWGLPLTDPADVRTA